MRKLGSKDHVISIRILRNVSVLLYVFLCVMFFALTGCKEEKQRRILLIHSFRENDPTYSELNTAIQQQFKKKKINADLKIFYLDSERYRASQEESRMFDFIDSIQVWQPELILVNDDQATYTLMQCGHPFVKTVPVVFAGVNFPDWELLARYPNVTGSWDKADYTANLELIEKTMGKMRVYINYDETVLGQRMFHEFQQVVDKDQYIFNYNSLVINKSLLNESNTPNHFVVDTALASYLSINLNRRLDKTLINFVPFRDARGAVLLGYLSGIYKYTLFLNTRYDHTSLGMVKVFSDPSFTTVREVFGVNLGVIGGYFCSNRLQAQEQVRIAASILNEKVLPKDILISVSPKEYLYDWRELQYRKMKNIDIPSYVQLANMPFSERHKIELTILYIIIGFFLVGLIFNLSFLYWREARRKREALLRLKQEKEHLSLALEGGNIFAWKLQSDVLYFDNEFFVFLDMQPYLIPVNELSKMLHPEDQKNFMEQIKCIRSTFYMHRSIRFRCDFNGKGYQWWEFRYGPADYINGVYVINGLCLNIQETKDTEASLIAAREKAEESDHMKSAFLANMSHEIRTPLNAIVGFSNLMVSEEALSDEEKRQFIDLINTNSDLLLKLINDILDLSRIESGRMDFVYNRHDLSQLVTEIYHTHQLLMPESVELRMQVPERAAIIEIDQHRLKQVLTNFINNAVKFTAAGHIEVGYVYCAEEKSIHLYVEDTGIGIPPEKQKIIFERFNKLDEFAQGSGLGLSICLVIAKRFGGEIRIRSEVGKGSRFIMTLPYAGPF